MLVYTFLLLLHFTSSSYSCTFFFFLSIIELFGNHSERSPARSHTFLSRLLFSCLSAFPRLLQITTTITKILLVSKRHTICGKLIKDDDFSFFFFRHQRENTQIMRSLTRSPTFPEKKEEKLENRSCCVLWLVHGKITLKFSLDHSSLWLIPFARSSS